MKTGTCKKTRSLWETFLCQDLQKVKCEAKGSFVKIAILLALKAYKAYSLIQKKDYPFLITLKGLNFVL